MKKTITEEKVYKVLEIIAGSPQLSQRQMATTTGFSLGLVNLIIKRLLQTGHIKVANLSRRKMQYLLTKKGLKEKASRTHVYVSRTIKVFSEYQVRLETLVTELVDAGCTSFAILGKGEIALLMEMCLKNAAPGAIYRFINEDQRAASTEAVLDCRLNVEKGNIGVSILSRLLPELQLSIFENGQVLTRAVGVEN